MRRVWSHGEQKHALLISVIILIRKRRADEHLLMKLINNFSAHVHRNFHQQLSHITKDTFHDDLREVRDVGFEVPVGNVNDIGHGKRVIARHCIARGGRV